MDINKHVLIFKALGDNTRLQIVQMLSDGEMCACKILERFQITQPTLSHHMKILCESGIVKAKKVGKWSYYSLCCEELADFCEFVSSLKFVDGGECNCR